MSILLILIIVYFIASWLDKRVYKNDLKEFRGNLNALSISLESGSSKEVTIQFNKLICDLFDKIYDDHHFSEKRLKRSIVSSVLGIIIFSAFFGFENTANEILYLIPERRFGFIFAVTLVIFAAPFFFNIIPDYFSLIETRIVLELARGKNMFVIFSLLILDVILTSLIFFIGFYIFIAFSKLLIQMDSGIIDTLNIDHKAMFSLEFLKQFLTTNLGKVFLLTTFITSFFWISFVVFFILIRLFYRFNSTTQYLIKQIRISDKPVTILVTGFNLFVLTLYAILHLLL